MSAALLERQAQAGTRNGGVPARRAVIRWAWRMFRREWRQQLLVLALITVALAAVVVGAAVATDTPSPAGAGFGTAQDAASYPGGPHLASQIAALQQRFGRVDVIENQVIAIPGSISTYDLRAQDPNGPFGQPMLSLVAGHYPTGPGQVAVTDGVASTFGLRIGDVWHQGGTTRQVTGIVQNPQSLLDEFALVVPGQVSAPTQVTVLFDAPGVSAYSLGPNVQTRQSAAASNPLNPETIVLGLATVGMLLIALVAVGGFTVLAQRRLRSLGMLGALGATDRNIRLVVRVNGVLVGLIGALAGTVLGLAIWLAYRPTAEADAHHLIGTFAVPWNVVGPAIALAVVATYFAAARPARSITRIPLVAALSGRPAPPKQVRRSAMPGVVLFVIAAALLSYSGKSNGNGGGGALELVRRHRPAHRRDHPAGALLPGGAGQTGAAGPDRGATGPARPGPLPGQVRLGPRGHQPRGLHRRPGLRADRAAVRERPGLRRAEPGQQPDHRVHAQRRPRGGGQARQRPRRRQYIRDRQHAAGPGGGRPEHRQGPRLEHPHRTRAEPAPHCSTPRPGVPGPGRCTWLRPQLLAAFGIKASEVNPNADILTMRPGLSGVSDMQLVYGGYFASQGGGQVSPGNGPGNGPVSYPCPKGQCLANPVIQEVGALPSGTSAPNTVITEHALRTLGLNAGLQGWLIQAPHNPTAAQITNARLTAGAAGMTIETKSSTPSSAEILDYATAFGIALALGILAMSVGLIRSETARDLRTLTATGAGSLTRRELTAATAFALALAGAVLGTVAAYVAAIGYAWDNPLDGLSELSSVPTENLLFILVGMPVVAAVIGWLLASREPAVISRQPLE